MCQRKMLDMQIKTIYYSRCGMFAIKTRSNQYYTFISFNIYVNKKVKKICENSTEKKNATRFCKVEIPTIKA